MEEGYNMKKPLNVTFDTNIFDESQFDLSKNSPISQLVKYVNHGDIRVFLSNIVIGEMKQHCTEYARLISSKIRGVRDDIQKGVLSGDKTKEYHKVSDVFIEAIGYSYILQVPNKTDAEKASLDYLNNYIKSLKVIELKSESVNIDDIFFNYFHKIPPFEDSEKKKNEFPDAVIAAQIKQRFNENEPIYVVTRDNGLQRALKDVPYCTIISSLGELYEIIIANKTEYQEKYASARSTIESVIPNIKQQLDDALYDETKISLEGMEYDKDGISSGYDYDEIYYTRHEIQHLRVFAIDHFDDESITARLSCIVEIEAECSYEDYANAVWDSEEKEYLFLDTITNIEIHHARFALGVIIDRKNNSISSLKFHVYLGGDSRIDRYERIICPNCGKVISLENDGENGLCIDCTSNQ